MSGWSSSESFRLWSHFSSAAASFESPGVSVPASPARSFASDARHGILVQTHYKRIIVEKAVAFGDPWSTRRGQRIRCTLAYPEASIRTGTVLRRPDMLQPNNHSAFSRRLALRLAKTICSCLVILLAHLPPAHAQAQDHSTDALRKLNESVDAIIKKVSPSVVQILVTGYGPLEDGEHGNTTAVIGRQRARGERRATRPGGAAIGQNRRHAGGRAFNSHDRRPGAHRWRGSRYRSRG